MDKELIFFLEKGPTSVKELARLTGKSTSTIYKNLKEIEGVEEASFDPPLPSGAAKLYFIKPQETTEDVAGANAAPNEVEIPTPAAPVAPAPSSEPQQEKRGRKATAAGKQLYPDASLLGTNDNEGDGATPTYQNPRRKNSAGFKSLQLILEKPGITTEDYVKAGGRLNDLRWDLAHGNVRAE